MMASAKPHKPLPVIAPSSVCVKPKARAQSSRMPLRIEKPTPEAVSVMKLARNRRARESIAARMLHRNAREGNSKIRAQRRNGLRLLAPQLSCQINQQPHNEALKDQGKDHPEAQEHLRFCEVQL